MKHHTFVTFLGRGQQHRETGEWVYRKATYEFPATPGSSKTHQKTTEFFGLALAEYIKPTRVVILGTRGSQWGVLVNKLASEDEEEAARLKLLIAEENQTVNDNMLEYFRPLMQRTVKPDSAKIVPILIPFGKEEDDQYRILDIISKNVPDGKVDLDLTHGFRHFGMIGFLSAFMLARIRAFKLKVNTLWYGALDMTQDEGGITPVLQLDGLDRVRQWLDALNRFDATGDYRIFSDLLTKDAVAETIAKHLENAAFYERTLNLTAAAHEIRKFTPVLNGSLKGASGLFQQRLAERLAWVNLSTLSEQQTELAWQYLDRRDYVRAAILGWEAVITRVCEKKGCDPTVRAIREDQHVVSEVQYWPLRNGQRSGDNREAAEILNRIRRALAHGSEERPQALDDEQQLRDTLKKALKTLLQF